MSRTLRIAVGQISSESNNFITHPAELDFFRNTGFLYERDELFQLAGTGGEVGGMLAVFANEPEVEIVPLLAARGNSSGPLSAACYGYLREHILAPLQAAQPVDGVIISHHGSMVTEDEDDPEGDIAGAVRKIVGPAVPFVMTLDLHGNVTRRMIKATNAILGYEQYPHYDVFSTGQRAAALLLQAVRGEVQAVMAHAKLNMIVTGFNGSTTGDGPFARLMRKAKELEKQSGILTASVFCVGSYIDVPDMGCSAVVVANDDTALATDAVARLAGEFWDVRQQFQVEKLGVTEAVERGRAIAGGPVLLLDTADTTGGGAAGDSIDLVKGLLEAGVTEPCLAMVIDPQAAEVCHKAGIGQEVSLIIGHKLDPSWGAPLCLTGTVLRLSDGQFRYTGGILGGSEVTMGASAVLQIGSISLLIMSHATYDWADEQYRAVGLDPAQAKFVGVKNMMNFRHGYKDTMKAFFVLDLPGPTPPDMSVLPFKRVNRPLFPLDAVSSPAIEITTSAQ